MKKLIFLVMTSLLLSSCLKHGYIKVQNSVHNVKLENISFGNYSLFSTILPGEISDETRIEDDKDQFPKTEQLSFYMESNGKKVYLKTKTKYSLDYGETLLIVISDTTEVVNPLIK